MNYLNEIICGNALDVLKAVPDGVTCPPEVPSP